MSNCHAVGDLVWLEQNCAGPAQYEWKIGQERLENGHVPIEQGQELLQVCDMAPLLLIFRTSGWWQAIGERLNS